MISGRALARPARGQAERLEMIRRHVLTDRGVVGMELVEHETPRGDEPMPGKPEPVDRPVRSDSIADGVRSNVPAMPLAIPLSRASD